MSTSTTNDGFHEIQLNGKQLVFLGMAVVVVSVVIFLMGVLVGRGVSSAKGPVPEAPISAAIQEPASTDVPTAPAMDEPPSPVDDGPAGNDAPSGVIDTLHQKDGTAVGLAQPSKPAATASAAPSPSTGRAANPSAAPPPAATTAAATTPADRGTVSVPVDPGGDGWALQVAALADKGDAEAMVTRLLGKEYTAYLVLPSGGSTIYRVRVGKFKDKREADRVAGRLSKEEKFKPWVIK